ncbi:Phosphatase 2A-2 [Hibiscus syriacus]|uniref:Phosphatase 2A-2 n=1 Tax=Hibiscus syriacus TaxID=106335 RepID=A0A6A3A4T4_HIBSY|nr:CLAVATA3/ESR (CLE)-related protein 26-like [Hibiscus syriacus]KAE8698886.1 Phosphatase 2A-2 [Hibiscus syriacus]
MGAAGSSLLFRTLVVLGFMLVISNGIQQRQDHKTKTTITGVDHRSWTSTTAAKLQQREEQVKVLGKGKSSVAHPKQDLNYMSKRRVPNGPDPIHNRRAGNSGRPPGQA